jgi:hypothetical protein
MQRRKLNVNLSEKEIAHLEETEDAIRVATAAADNTGRIVTKHKVIFPKV